MSKSSEAALALKLSQSTRSPPGRRNFIGCPAVVKKRAPISTVPSSPSKATLVSRVLMPGAKWCTPNDSRLFSSRNSTAPNPGQGRCARRVRRSSRTPVVSTRISPPGSPLRLQQVTTVRPLGLPATRMMGRKAGTEAVTPLKLPKPFFLQTALSSQRSQKCHVSPSGNWVTETRPPSGGNWISASPVFSTVPMSEGEIGSNSLDIISSIPLSCFLDA